MPYDQSQMRDIIASLLAQQSNALAGGPATANTPPPPGGPMAFPGAPPGLNLPGMPDLGVLSSGTNTGQTPAGINPGAFGYGASVPNVAAGAAPPGGGSGMAGVRSFFEGGGGLPGAERPYMTPPPSPGLPGMPDMTLPSTGPQPGQAPPGITPFNPATAFGAGRTLPAGGGPPPTMGDMQFRGPPGGGPPQMTLPGGLGGPQQPGMPYPGR